MKTSKIPDFPKIRINNYIPNLSNKIRIKLEDNIIFDFINDDVLNTISSRLNYKKDTLKKYLKNKKFPLFFLKELNRLTKKEVFRTIEEKNPGFVSKRNVAKLPRFITPKLAYFIGYL